MYSYHGKTMRELHDNMVLSLVTAPHDEVDTYSSIDVSRHNVIGEADSMEWTFDLKTMWLTQQRWTMMVRQYLDAADVMTWLSMIQRKIGKRGRGQALLRTRLVAARGGEATGQMNLESRRWGSCMISVSYKSVPKPTIVLHSRTSYLGYLSMMDFSIAWQLGRYVARLIDIDIKDISFVWMAESIQWHSFKSLPFLICNDDPEIRALGRRLVFKKLANLDEEERAAAQGPALYITRAWMKKLRQEDERGMTYGDMKYNSYRRIRRRWHTEVWGYKHAQTFEGGQLRRDNIYEYFKAYHPLPSVPIETLDLRSLKMPFHEGWEDWVHNVEGMLQEPDLLDCTECGGPDYDPYWEEE